MKTYQQTTLRVARKQKYLVKTKLLPYYSYMHYILCPIYSYSYQFSVLFLSNLKYKSFKDDMEPNNLCFKFDVFVLTQYLPNKTG